MGLFPQPQTPQNSMLAQLQGIRQMMGGNPQGDLLTRMEAVDYDMTYVLEMNE